MEQTDVVTRLRAVTGVSTAHVTDVDLNEIINAAVDEYCHYKPGIALTAAADAITTVSGQSNYPIPSGALWVIAVYWSPGYSGDELLDEVSSVLTADSFDPMHPSELYINFSRYAEIRKFFQGRWSVINKEIWLSPPPTVNDQKVAVAYATIKTLDDLSEVGDNPFFELCKGLVYERRSNDLQSGGGWSAGTYRVSPQLGIQMSKRAKEILDRTRAIIANAYYATKNGSDPPVPSER